MKLHFYGGAGMVTGSNYLIETPNTKVLIDCGLFQEGEEAPRLNSYFPYSPEEIDAVLITHSHIDHIGRLPFLIKSGFRGKIYSTPPTKDLAHLMLIDNEGLMFSAASQNKKSALYNLDDVEKTTGLFEGIGYHQKTNLGDLSFCFREAGHILGSAIIEVWGDNKKIVFSGDLGNPPVPLLRPTEFISETDYVLVESAYGDKLHQSREKRRDILEDTIEEISRNNGVLLIPILALERTQEILYELNHLVENERVPQMPIFVDSPLAIKLTDAYRRYRDYFNQEAVYLIKSGDDLFNFPGLKMTETVEESKMINNVNAPKIILAGSGMSTGGRILHHELRYLSGPKNILLFICYQTRGALGRDILDGAKEVEIMKEKVPVNLKIRTIAGYSAHADQEGLYQWIANMKESVKKVFVVQGEEEPSNALAQRVKDHLGLSTEVPKIGQIVELK